MDQEKWSETWVKWKQRTTREALEAIGKTGVPDWADDKRCRAVAVVRRVARRLDGRWRTRAIHFTSAGFRKQGHPKRRWEDASHEYFAYKLDAYSWMHKTHDQDWW